MIVLVGILILAAATGMFWPVLLAVITVSACCWAGGYLIKVAGKWLK